jgi:hypothetical protein
MFAASKSGKPAAAGAVTDPNFNSTTLLLETTGTNGQQNNTFLDSSTNNFTITRTGTPTQGTFTPFSQTGWGGYFNGTNAYLTAPNNVAFNFGTGSVTVECWINLSAYTNSGSIIDFGNGATSARLLLFQSNTSGNISAWSGGSSFITSSSTVPLNTWTHVAFVRNGSACALYLNGVSVGTATNSNNWTDANCFIGTLNDNLTIFFSGYISNLRVVKGTAVYTSNFTPSTTPLTAVSGTSLLTLQDNRFKDNSSNNFAITATGTPSIQAFSPFAPAAAYSTSAVGGSVYFNGTTDYLSVASSTAFGFGTGDVTIECWLYTLNAASGGNQEIIDLRTTNTAVPIALGISSTGYPYAYNGTSYTSSVIIVSSTWNHVALVRSGSGTNNCKLYLNGIQVTQFTDTSDWRSTNNFAIGRNTGAAVEYFIGYISNARVVKGTALYTANFTPPTAPLTAVTNTSLLLNATNAGIYDATAKNDVTTVSNAQVSTAQSQFGGSSMLFNGTSDYLTAINTPNLQLGTGDFTIEGWVYLTTGSTARGYISKGPSAATTGWELRFNAANFLRFEWTASFVVGTTAIPTNTWTFVTVVRSGTATGNVKLYVNGALYATSSVAVTTDFNQTDPLRIGIDRAGTAFFPGYTDDIRITKGIARYTAAFTAPTAPFPVS